MFDQNFEHTQFVREKNRLKFGKFVKKNISVKKGKNDKFMQSEPFAQMY